LLSLIINFCFSKEPGGSAEPLNSPLIGFQLPFNWFDCAAMFIVLLQTRQRINSKGNIIDRIKVLLKFIKIMSHYPDFKFEDKTLFVNFYS
jgi:hypothetical protein